MTLIDQEVGNRFLLHLVRYLNVIKVESSRVVSFIGPSRCVRLRCSLRSVQDIRRLARVPLARRSTLPLLIMHVPQAQRLCYALRDPKRVQARVEELLIDLQPLLQLSLKILEHAQRYLPLDLFRASGVQSSVKSNQARILNQGHLDYQFQPVVSNLVA